MTGHDGGKQRQFTGLPKHLNMYKNGMLASYAIVGGIILLYKLKSMEQKAVTTK